MGVDISDLYKIRMKTMMGSRLLTCLLLILGIKTEQHLLLLPWQLYHGAIILGCFGGGLYQALHYTVLAEREDSLLAYYALFPVAGGIFFLFIWLLVHQLAIRMRYRRQLDRVVEEKRASLASIHLHLQRQPEAPYENDNHRSVRSIPTLKRRREGARSQEQMPD